MFPPGLVLLLAAAGPGLPSNTLLLIADDVGVDRLAAYGLHPDPPPTPHLDALAASGVLFETVWANPTCSPTRATILTGRYGFRTGVGRAMYGNWTVTGPGSTEPAESYALPLEERTLPELLAEGTGGLFHTAALGKWHLAGPARAPLHPLECGFDTHRGSLFNFGQGQGFTGWQKHVDGAMTWSTLYATTDTVDDAIEQAIGLPEPWLLWVAFNASHTPLHAPPPELHSQPLRGPPSQTPIAHMEAMTEALDTEIGRLLASLPADLLARTNVVFVGDNGTAGVAAEPPLDPDHAKATLYEGGVRVPLIVAGPAVRAPGRRCEALVNTTDLCATILELSGVDPDLLAAGGRAHDAVSLVPHLVDPTAPSLRAYAYAERFGPNGPPPHAFHRRAIRDARFKLHTNQDGEEELFDLARDPAEEHDLLLAHLKPEAAEALTRLRAALREVGTPGSLLRTIPASSPPPEVR